MPCFYKTGKHVISNARMMRILTCDECRGADGMHRAEGQARQSTRAAVRCKDACSPASCFYTGQWELAVPGLILFSSPVASSLRVFCSRRFACCGAFLRWAHELCSASYIHTVGSVMLESLMRYRPVGCLQSMGALLLFRLHYESRCRRTAESSHRSLFPDQSVGPPGRSLPLAAWR
jgi:hypothetical protein